MVHWHRSHSLQFFGAETAAWRLFLACRDLRIPVIVQSSDVFNILDQIGVIHCVFHFLVLEVLPGLLLHHLLLLLALLQVVLDGSILRGIQIGSRRSALLRVELPEALFDV